MIYLLNLDKLQIITSAAISLDVNANGIDAAVAGLTAPAPYRLNTAIVTATTTDVFATPGSGIVRTLKQMTGRNKHATLAGDVTLVYNQNGTTFELYKTTLNPGESFIYIEGVGFFLLKATAILDKLLFTNGDQNNATVAFTDISGLTVPLLAGKRYAFDATIFHLSALATTGANFGFNIGAAPTRSIVGNWSGITNSVTAGVGSLGTATARDTAITAQTTGSSGVTMTNIEGTIVPSADGTFALRFSSEVAGSAVTVKGDSWMKIRQEQ